MVFRRAPIPGRGPTTRGGRSLGARAGVPSSWGPMCANRVKAYGEDMATHTHPIRGSTAATRPRRRLGDALRAVGIFADTAFRVVVLGTDGEPPADRTPPEPPDLRRH